MPFHLNYFVGGMGNQIFQISSLISLAEKYDTTFNFPRDIKYIRGLVGNIPIYHDTIFDKFTNHPRYKDYNSILPSIDIQIVQFQDMNLDNIEDKKNIQINISGLPMWLPIINISLIRNILLENKKEFSYNLNSTGKIKLCVCFRTFDEEGHNEWMIPSIYYRNAFKAILPKLNNKIEIHIFTDRENVKDTIIKPILNDLNIEIPDLYEYKGIRNGISDIEHFYKMMDCDHFILCNSTYHYWPALIKNSESIITYPNKIEDGTEDWFKTLCPEKWIQIDYIKP